MQENNVCFNNNKGSECLLISFSILESLAARYFIDDVIDGQIIVYCGTGPCEIRDHRVRADALAGAWPGATLRNMLPNNLVL